MQLLIQPYQASKPCLKFQKVLDCSPFSYQTCLPVVDDLSACAVVADVVVDEIVARHVAVGAEAHGSIAPVVVIDL